jgi:hypothetical protein
VWPMASWPSHDGARAAPGTGTGARTAWRHGAAPASAARVYGKQHTGRRCGGLTDVTRRQRQWGASPVRKLNGRERCGGDAHIAGEEAVWRAATYVGERGEVSDELGSAAAGAE